MGPRAQLQQKIFLEQAKAKIDEMKEIEEELRQKELEDRFPKKRPQLDIRHINTPDSNQNDECITFWSQQTKN
jgi:hypothetical protein